MEQLATTSPKLAWTSEYRILCGSKRKWCMLIRVVFYSKSSINADFGNLPKCVIARISLMEVALIEDLLYSISFWPKNVQYLHIVPTYFSQLVVKEIVEDQFFGDMNKVENISFWEWILVVKMDNIIVVVKRGFIQEIDFLQQVQLGLWLKKLWTGSDMDLITWLRAV